MKTLQTTLLLALLSTASLATTNLSLKLNGAWQTSRTTSEGEEMTLEVTFMEGYFSIAAYSIASKQFYYTMGGSWNLEGEELTRTWEFNTKDKTMVGKVNTSPIQMKGSRLIVDGHSWKRIDDGTPGELAGAWLITGRKRDGEISRRTPGARKTMKILSGTRFQWIAYNTETGEFFGTGGGTYTTKEGNYTENIEFFSRDGSRVGASLPFNYELIDNEWHHSGLSSKGKPIYEIWTSRSMLE